MRSAVLLLSAAVFTRRNQLDEPTLGVEAEGVRVHPKNVVAVYPNGRSSLGDLVGLAEETGGPGGDDVDPILATDALVEEAGGPGGDYVDPILATDAIAAFGDHEHARHGMPDAIQNAEMQTRREVTLRDSVLIAEDFLTKGIDYQQSREQYAAWRASLLSEEGPKLVQEYKDRLLDDGAIASFPEFRGVLNSLVHRLFCYPEIEDACEPYPAVDLDERVALNATGDFGKFGGRPGSSHLDPFKNAPGLFVLRETWMHEVMSVYTFTRYWCPYREMMSVIGRGLQIYAILGTPESQNLDATVFTVGQTGYSLSTMFTYLDHPPSLQETLVLPVLDDLGEGVPAGAAQWFVLKQSADLRIPLPPWDSKEQYAMPPEKKREFEGGVEAFETLHGGERVWSAGCGAFFLANEAERGFCEGDHSASIDAHIRLVHDLSKKSGDPLAEYAKMYRKLRLGGALASFEAELKGVLGSMKKTIYRGLHGTANGGGPTILGAATSGQVKGEVALEYREWVSCAGCGYMRKLRFLLTEDLVALEAAGYPYRQTIVTVERCLQLLDVLYRSNQEAKIFYHTFRYRLYLITLLDDEKVLAPAKSVTFPTVYSIGSSNLIRIRAVPILMLGVQSAPEFADMFMNTPLDFWSHDIQHMRRQLQETFWYFDTKVRHRTYLTQRSPLDMVPIETFYAEMKAFTKSINDLWSIKVSRRKGLEGPELEKVERDFDLRRLKRLIIFEIVHEKAWPVTRHALCENIRRSYDVYPVEGEKALKVIDGAIHNTAGRYADPTTLGSLRWKIRYGFYDIPEDPELYAARGQSRTGGMIGEAAWELMREIGCDRDQEQLVTMVGDPELLAQQVGRKRQEWTGEFEDLGVVLEPWTVAPAEEERKAKHKRFLMDMKPCPPGRQADQGPCRSGFEGDAPAAQEGQAAEDTMRSKLEEEGWITTDVHTGALVTGFTPWKHNDVESACEQCSPIKGHAEFQGVQIGMRYAGRRTVTKGRHDVTEFLFQWPVPSEAALKALACDEVNLSEGIVGTLDSSYPDDCP